jgi:Protein of unknown function (DUF3089)
MRSLFLGATLAAATAAVPAIAQPLPPLTLADSPVDYAKDSNWLCLPGRKDACSTPIPTTDLLPGGYGVTVPSTVAPAPTIDCFYVYPTVSRDKGLNADLTPQEEPATARAQFARFAAVCRPFAPLYRQMTVGAVTAAMAGGDVAGAYAIAYRDVVTAWQQFLRARNAGRPFVLVGHSQGSLMLQGLIAREIEGKPIARQMLLAIIPGYNVMVPAGKRVGGSFRLTPLCSRLGERGCVISFVTYREGSGPAAGARFGLADRPGFTVGCVNPAAIGSTGWAVADGIWPTASRGPALGGPIRWSTKGTSSAQFVRTPGLVSLRCVSAGQAGFLSLHTNAVPADPRTDRVPGEPGLDTPFGPVFLPGWGMHLADMQHSQLDLIRAVAAVTPRP